MNIDFRPDRVRLSSSPQHSGEAAVENCENRGKAAFRLKKWGRKWFFWEKKERNQATANITTWYKCTSGTLIVFFFRVLWLFYCFYDVKKVNLIKRSWTFLYLGNLRNVHGMVVRRSTAFSESWNLNFLKCQELGSWKRKAKRPAEPEHAQIFPKTCSSTSKAQALSPRDGPAAKCWNSGKFKSRTSFLCFSRKESLMTCAILRAHTHFTNIHPYRSA